MCVLTTTRIRQDIIADILVIQEPRLLMWKFIVHFLPFFIFKVCQLAESHWLSYVGHLRDWERQGFWAVSLYKSSWPCNSRNRCLAKQWVVCFSGHHEETNGVWWNRVHLDLRVLTGDDPWRTEHEHHQRNVYTLGRLQQLCCGEINYFHDPFHYIPATTDGDALLLLQNCLQLKTQS